jgi:hypothetical protein
VKIMKTEMLGHDRKPREKTDPRVAVADPSRQDLFDAITRAFGEYRQRIADIRALHGRSARKSILH